MYAAMLISPPAQAQNKTEAIAYGANPAAGHYLTVDNTKIYYETYGSGGTPLVLLHGGLYGYIEEFGELIGEMSKHRRPGLGEENPRNQNEERNVVFSARLLAAVSGRKSAYSRFFVAVEPGRH
jgi:hypothetical protein